MTETSRPFLSVIIPVYNARPHLPRLLKAIDEQDYPGRWEVIAVDDGSSDGSDVLLREWAKSSSGRHRWISQPNQGPAAARNAGALQAWGEIVVFTDSDCLPPRDWLTRIAQRWQEAISAGGKELAAVCGGYHVINDQSLLARCIQAEIDFRHQRLLKKGEVQVFGTYNVAVNKAVFDAVGGFDASYPSASGEDNDLSYRLIRAGYRIVFDGQITVGHQHPENVLVYLKDQFRHGFFRAKMYRRHPSMMRGDGYTFSKDVLEVGAAAGVMGLFFFSWWWPGASTAALIVTVVLWVGQFPFVWTLRLSEREAMAFSGVMFLRAFARALGFLCGVPAFLF